MAASLDPRLAWKLQDYLERRRMRGAEVEHEGDAVVSLTVTFQQSIEPIKAAGFMPARVRGTIARGTVRIRDLQALSELPQVVGLESSERLSARLDTSVPAIGATAVHSGSPSYKGTGVIVGIVDSGVDVTHHTLRDDAGDSRILALWDQTLLTGGVPPAPYTKGVLFERAAINAIINPAVPPPTPVAFPSQDSGHGTHVASTAAGDGSQAGNCSGAGTYVGVAPAADLVIVKTTFQDDDLVDAVEWIFSRAAVDQGAVVNLSLGTDAGAHDGLASLDTDMNALVGADGRVIVASSGNASESQHARKTVPGGGTRAITYEIGSGSRFTDFVDLWYGGASRLTFNLKSPLGATTPDVAPPGAAGIISAAHVIDGHTVDMSSRILDPAHGLRHRLTLRVRPPLGGTIANGPWVITLRETAGTDAETHCWITWAGRVFEAHDIAASGNVESGFHLQQNWKHTDECEITYTGDARLSIAVTSPGGDSIAAVAAGTTPDPPPTVPGHIIRVSSRVAAPGGTHRITFRITRDTSGLTGSKKYVATGKWRFKLTETAGHATRAECRMPGDRYTDACPQLIIADRDPSCSIGSPAAADNVIAVGSYNHDGGALAKSSGRGPRLDHVGLPAPAITEPRKPDVIAPGVGIVAAKSGARGSPICCDCCIDFYVAESGTSMAAPHVTGVVALMLQKDASLPFDEVRRKLRESADPTPAAYTEPSGWGKVNATRAMALVAAPEGAEVPEIVIAPAAAPWRRFEPIPERIRALEATLGSVPAGRLLIALTSEHYDEVARLIRTVRRVAAAWRLMAGAEVLREVLLWSDPTIPVLPRAVQDRPLVPGLKRLLRELQRVATPVLQRDIVAYQQLVLALPGANLSSIASLTALSDGGTARNARAHSA